MKVVINVQKLYALIVTYMLSFLALLNLTNALLNRIGIYTVLDTVLLYGLLVGLVFLGVLASVAGGRALKLDDILLIGFLGFSFVLSWLMHPENKRFLFTSWLDYSKNPLYAVFLYSVPGYYFVRRLQNYDYFRKIMAGFSYAVVSMAVAVYFTAKDSAAMQYMTFSYNMLTQLLFLCLYPPKKRNLLHYAVVAAGLFVFIVGGARGAMISFFLTLGLSFFIRNKGTKKNVLICLALVAVGIAFAFLKNSLFLFIADLLERFSVDSRTFEFLIKGELFNDSHRMKLYSKTVANIGFFGAGVMSDRMLLNDIYPHNLFLELWYQNGWILGSVLIAGICTCLALALRKKNRPELPFVIMLLPCGFLKLMLTGSYLNQEPAFYVLMGLCVNSILRGNRNADSTDQHGLRGRQHR